MNDKKKYKLLILESPHKAAVVGKFLTGLNFKVVASKGHILELDKSELGINLKTFELDLKPIPDKKNVIEEIKKLAKDAEEIYLGTDADREGAIISSNINDLIKVGKKIPVHRVLFYEITKSAILKAIANPTVIDIAQCNAQKTRRVLDRLVGYKVSPILWDKLGGGAKSAGRVQSVALRLVVDREDEIKNFVPKKFFQIIAKLKKDEITFDSKYFGEILDKKTDLNEANEVLARQIHTDVQNQNFIVKNIETKEKKIQPSAPFTTSRLQQEASTKLKFNSKLTMSTAQALYEGISLGDKGEQGLITYMRTDSVRTEPQALLDVRTYIDSKFGKTYLPNEAVIYKKKKTDVAAQDAHESIRPTNLDNDPETIKEFLTRDEYELYKLIWNKFISSQMNPTVLDQTVATFEVHKHFFRSVGSVVLFDGFKAVYVDGDDKKDDDDDGALPKLVLQEALTPIEPPKLLEKFTSPPPRYTEATIIKTLEERGIGRPSTFSAIITNITDRQYVIKKEGKFHPTEVGTTLCYFLVKHFTQEMEYSFTAKFEDKLDQIEDGTLIWTDVLKEFWDGLSATIEKTQKEVESVAKPQGPRPIKPEAKTGIICPKCNTGELIIINGAKGDFLGCSAYPTCNKTSAFKKNKKGEVTLLEKKETIHKDPCPKCGSPMALRSGKFGEFFGCTKKDCNTTRPKTTGIICPDCKVGEFTQIKTKAGSTFYGCSNFRNGCKNSLNFKPLEEPCKNCQYPVRGCDDTNPQSIKLVCPKCRKVETL